MGSITVSCRIPYVGDWKMVIAPRSVQLIGGTYKLLNGTRPQAKVNGFVDFCVIVD